MGKSSYYKAIKTNVSFAMKQVDKDLDASLKATNNKLYDEATHMYDTFISQYYLYKTKSYIRHHEGVPGTREGQNLYDGKDIRKYNGHMPKLSIFFPGDTEYTNHMEGGYQYDTPDDVLDNVISGFRGVPDKWLMPWYGSYRGRYFSYTGNMKAAFDTFNANFEYIARPIIYNELKKKGY